MSFQTAQELVLTALSDDGSGLRTVTDNADYTTNGEAFRRVEIILEDTEVAGFGAGVAVRDHVLVLVTLYSLRNTGVEREAFATTALRTLFCAGAAWTKNGVRLLVKEPPAAYKPFYHNAYRQQTISIRLLADYTT